MKKIALISILLALLVAGCNSNKARITYYKYQKTGKVYNRNEFNKFKIQLTKKIDSMYNSNSKIHIYLNPNIQVLIVDSTSTHDSIIKTFSLNINLSISGKKAQPKKEKIYSYLNKKLPLPILYSINNEKIDISKLNGKPTLLNFWFTTCNPCIDEMPVLNQIMNKYKGKINFIAITFENKKSVEAFLRKHEFNFVQIAGASEFIKNTLGIEHFPKNIFIDRNGIVRRIEDGVPYVVKNGKLKMGKGKEFEEYLEKLL